VLVCDGKRFVMPNIPHKVIDDEPEGGWLGPSGPGPWTDLQELDQRQRAAKGRK
jgi:hypothetical protein